ncbi:hypothetical protein [Citreimonas salinaria]|uniref:Uncharacterized protein n=1 Tax=Citreimonas salinaria TaxID=321339 RepID=A0A1H3LAW2_9RHOB|nr:hypothetical protein [Citreimonas salinaria]SDY61717.1 hypothetical protein SAMN05444340_11256 [Citreimonas salinaria]
MFAETLAPRLHEMKARRKAHPAGAPKQAGPAAGAGLGLLVALLGGGPVHAQVPPCEGTYEVFFGKSTTAVAPGNTMPKAGRIAQAYNNREGWVGQVIRKPQSEGMHQIAVGDCGRQFVVTQGANQMLFLQSASDETIYVAQDIDDVPGEMTVRVVDHKIMVGQFAGQSHGFKFNFPIAMEPHDVVMPDMEGCADEEEAADEDRFPVDPELRGEVLDIVSDEIGLPRDLAPRYMASRRSVVQNQADADRVTPLVPGERGCTEAIDRTMGCFDQGPEAGRVVEATMVLDAQGRLLPVTMRADGSVHADDPAAADFCAEGGTLPAATHRLSITLWSPEGAGMNDAQAILADYDTRIAREAHYADGRGAGHTVRARAIGEAYRGVGAPVTGRH